MEELIGVVKLWAGVRVPRNYRLCNGERLPIRGNEKIFTIISNRFGSDMGYRGEWFNLPDMRPVDESGHRLEWGESDVRYIICVEGVYPMHNDF